MDIRTIRGASDTLYQFKVYSTLGGKKDPPFSPPDPPDREAGVYIFAQVLSASSTDPFPCGVIDIGHSENLYSTSLKLLKGQWDRDEKPPYFLTCTRDRSSDLGRLRDREDIVDDLKMMYLSTPSRDQ